MFSDFFFFGGFVGLRFELKSFMLAYKELYHVSYTYSPFCSGYFGDGVLRTICLDRP
jgi:hypothetical protein